MNLLLTQDTRGVARLTLNRPEVRNAFNDALIAELIVTLKKLSVDPSVRVLELRGAGKVFCAGADLAWMQSMANYSYGENVSDADQLAELLYTLDAMPVPTIAIVQGAAYGGGLGLIAACDLALAEKGTQFCLSEVKLGLIPAVISPFVLAKVGEKAMRRYALTAEVFDAEKAVNIGLLDQALEASVLEAEVERFVELLLKNSSEAMAEMKKLLPLLHSEKDVRRVTVEAIARCRVSTSAQERLKKFLGK